MSPNFQTLVNSTDSFDVLVNGEKVNGASLGYTSLFPVSTSATSTAVNDLYMMVDPGDATIQLVDQSSSVLATFTKTLNAGSYYSLNLTDSLFSSRDSAKIFVQDNFYNSIFLDGYAKFRFINAVTTDSTSPSTGKTTVDVYSYARNAVVFSAIKPDSITVFSNFSVNLGVADTFYVTRTPASTGTVLLSQRVILAKIALTPQTSSVTGIADNRAYTLYYYGDGTLSSGTTARAVTYYINK
ncbi:MAG: hypothetical protein QM610_13185 [Chitinophagaceae bacterium]